MADCHVLLLPGEWRDPGVDARNTDRIDLEGMMRKPLICLAGLLLAVPVLAQQPFQTVAIPTAMLCCFPTASAAAASARNVATRNAP